jgi:outer membrane protein OmpA-like peptidoglycan-associated protein
VGAIVVTSDGRETTLDRALMAARIGRAGAIETGTTTDAEVKRVFGPSLTAQPPRPMTFLLYFLHDSDELTAESQATVAAIVSEIGRRAVPEVVVVGHTDTVGTDEHNDRLSIQRAQRVRSGLLARGLGLPASDVLAAGRGKRETLVPTADQVAEPRNRRVEVVVR